MMICMLLCVYFSFHLLFGERGALKLVELSHEYELVSIEYNDLRAERDVLERKVIAMRSETIDPDLLEERIQIMLGVLPENAMAISY